MRFEFATATRIVFGQGALREAGEIARGLGSRALVVTGRNPRRAAQLLESLRAARVDAVTLPVPGEPALGDIDEGTRVARRECCDLVIGCGGGSALDAAKAIAGMLGNGGDLLDHLEVIGGGRPLAGPAAPLVAIPTTAGTGAEVTRNAVLGCPQHRVKVSLRSPHLLPKVALIDPELTLDLPPALTASTGLDALTQLLEPFVSVRASPLTDALCADGLRRVAGALRAAWADGGDLGARTDMALASLFGGLALANAGLGAVHGFAAPIGGMFPAPHGAVCAALLPHVMAANLRALHERQPDSAALARYAEAASLLTGDPQATADDGVEWVRQLVADLRIPGLANYGLTPDLIPTVVAKASQASSMRANPISLTEDELAVALASAI